LVAYPTVAWGRRLCGKCGLFLVICIMDTVANKAILAALLSPNAAYEFLTRHWTHQPSVAQGDQSYPYFAPQLRFSSGLGFTQMSANPTEVCDS
jgi:hypothetical protein